MDASRAEKARMVDRRLSNVQRSRDSKEHPGTPWGAVTTPGPPEQGEEVVLLAHAGAATTELSPWQD